jgi:hypothetical protein
LFLLLGLVFVLKALVPAGWMPVFGPDGVRLQLCGGWGGTSDPIAASTVTEAHAHQASASSRGDGDRSHEQSTHQPCTYAAMAMGWLPVDEARVPAPVIPSLMGTSLPTVQVGRGLAAPPPPSTGPPPFLS